MGRAPQPDALRRLVLGHACTRLDALAVAALNDTTTTLVVRIRASATTWSWLLRPSRSLTLLACPEPIEGVVELVDPETCTVLDESALPDHSFVAHLTPGVEDPPDYRMDLAPDTSTGLDPTPPDFTGCEQP